MSEPSTDPRRPALGAAAASAAFVALFLGFLVVGFAAQSRDVVLGLWITEALAIALPALIALRAANLKAVPYLGLSPPGFKWMALAVAAGLLNQPAVSLLEQAAHTFLPQALVAQFDAKNQMLERIFAQHRFGMIATVAIAAPLAEELFFRGFAQPAFSRSLGWAGAALLSGALFAFIHLDPVGFLGLWEIGVLLAVLRHASGSLWPSIAAHAVNNAVAAAAFILGMQDPSQSPPAWFLALGGVLLCAFAVVAARTLRRPPARPALERPRAGLTGPAAAALEWRRAGPLVAVWLAAVAAAAGVLLHLWG